MKDIIELRAYVKQQIDKADEKTLRMMQAMMEVAYHRNGKRHLLKEDYNRQQMDKPNKIQNYADFKYFHFR